MNAPSFSRELYHKAITNLSGGGQFYILLLLSKVDAGIGNTDISQLLSPVYELSVYSVNNIIHRLKLQGLVIDDGESKRTREQLIQKDYREIFQHIFAPVQDQAISEIVATYKKKREAGELATQLKKQTTRLK